MRALIQDGDWRGCFGAEEAAEENDHFSPPKEDEWPKAINVTPSFEEAMRLYLGLGRLLGKLNSYNRATKEGRESAVHLCV